MPAGPRQPAMNGIPRSGTLMRVCPADTEWPGEPQTPRQPVCAGAQPIAQVVVFSGTLGTSSLEALGRCGHTRWPGHFLEGPGWTPPAPLLLLTQTLTTCKRDLRWTACLCVQEPKSMENPLRGGREDAGRLTRGERARAESSGPSADGGSRCARPSRAPVGDKEVAA